MRHFLTQALRGLASISVLCVFISPTLSAQQVGKPGGNALNFSNTNSNGGQLAHIQSGALGSFTTSDRWIGIGNPTFSGSSLPVYGIRIQDAGQSGTLSLNDNNSSGDLDLELQWGPDTDSKFRLNFINNINNPSAITTILTALPNGNLGIGEDDPQNARLEVISAGIAGAIGPQNAIAGVNNTPRDGRLLRRRPDRRFQPECRPIQLQPAHNGSHPLWLF